MRPLLALAITVLLVGGTFAYIRFAESVRRTAVDVEIEYAEAAYSIEIRKTFRAASDPIFGSESLKVMFKGETVFATSNELSADKVTTISEINGVEVGENEIYVVANRADTESALAVMQVSILRDGIEIANQNLTSEPGLASVSGSIVFRGREKKFKNEGHDHSTSEDSQ